MKELKKVVVINERYELLFNIILNLIKEKLNHFVNPNDTKGSLD